MNPSESGMRGWRRRTFLGTGMGAVAGAGWAVTKPNLFAADHRVGDGSGDLVDVNVTLGHWPARRVALDDPRALVARLKDLGVRQAWAGHFDALIHKDLGAVNARLADTCRRHGGGFLIPFGTVNPLLPDADEELRRCAEVHRMPGLRLFPGYHGYSLGDPRLAALLAAAAKRGMGVQLVLAMEDERMMHPLLRVDPVDAAPLAGLVRGFPGLRWMLLNALRSLRARPLLEVLAAGRVTVDIAMLEGMGGLGTLLEQVPADRVLLGTHAPLFHPEAALLKLRETDPPPETWRAVAAGNARRWLRE